MPVVRILHISDMHEGQPGAETSWRQRRVLGDAWLASLDEIRKDAQQIDLVCFTGDIAFSGKATQYARATDFVTVLLDRLGISIERFFTIPGNHDIDRSIKKAAWKKIREQLSPSDAVPLSAWLSGGRRRADLQTSNLITY